MFLDETFEKLFEKFWTVKKQLVLMVVWEGAICNIMVMEEGEHLKIAWQNNDFVSKIPISK